MAKKDRIKNSALQKLDTAVIEEIQYLASTQQALSFFEMSETKLRALGMTDEEWSEIATTVNDIVNNPERLKLYCRNRNIEM